MILAEAGVVWPAGPRRRMYSMFRGRMLIATAVVALFMAAGMPLCAQQQQPVTAPVPSNSISIQAPPGVAPGSELCFTVTCYGGTPSVVVECEDVSLTSTITRTDDPSVYQVCCKVPGGASGSTLVI